MAQVMRRCSVDVLASNHHCMHPCSDCCGHAPSSRTLTPSSPHATTQHDSTSASSNANNGKRSPLPSTPLMRTRYAAYSSLCAQCTSICFTLSHFHNCSIDTHSPPIRAKPYGCGCCRVKNSQHYAEQNHSLQKQSARDTNLFLLEMKLFWLCGEPTLRDPFKRDPRKWRFVCTRMGSGNHSAAVLTAAMCCF
ncbi:hypothetical protein Tcan_11124 [Toxocara canis]|uniref:Uncharacterized protein n=1 Tax=Toxocara canis TaxID=6265 RepID=A0A0B2VC25_TOXCA|nr:hypothetical protein Tcan_11124 [Toxocara canis]